jgi:hypothetical protein
MLPRGRVWQSFAMCTRTSRFPTFPSQSPISTTSKVFPIALCASFRALLLTYSDEDVAAILECLGHKDTGSEGKDRLTLSLAVRNGD